MTICWNAHVAQSALQSLVKLLEMSNIKAKDAQREVSGPGMVSPVHGSCC